MGEMVSKKSHGKMFNHAEDIRQLESNFDEIEERHHDRITELKKRAEHASPEEVLAIKRELVQIRGKGPGSLQRSKNKKKRKK